VHIIHSKFGEKDKKFS